MNIQKSIVFYMSNGHKDSKIKYNTSYNHKKYADVCLTRSTGLFAERNKTVIKEHFKDINRERDTLWNDLEKSRSKDVESPQLICRFNTVFIKAQGRFFCRYIGYFKIYMERQRNSLKEIAKTILKNNKLERYQSTWF